MALMNCMECGGTISDSAKVCPHCGAPILKCRECHEVLPQGATVCPNCGAPVELIYEEMPVVRNNALKQNGSLSKGKIILGVVIVLLVFLLFTCPNEQKHKRVLEDRITLAIETLSDSLGVTEGWATLGNMFVNQITKMVVGNQFDVDSYGIFSVGKMHLNHQQAVITFGIAHHVFCFVSEDDVIEAIQKWQGEKKDDVHDFFSTIKEMFGFGRKKKDDVQEVLPEEEEMEGAEPLVNIEPQEEQQPSIPLENSGSI